jgi:hypothetical protein
MFLGDIVQYENSHDSACNDDSGEISDGHDANDSDDGTMMT